jgi:hypothetical protein
MISSVASRRAGTTLSSSSTAVYYRSATTMAIAKRIATSNNKNSGLRQWNNKHFNFSTTNKLSPEERDAAVRHANKAMKGYTQTRILAKQGKLPSKNRQKSDEHQSANVIQFSIFISLAVAFIVSPILGRKIAQDDEFREKYIPAWYDFRVKPPKSAWTRKELHDQIVEVERDMRERAIRGDFTPDKLDELKSSLQPRSDLSHEDMEIAQKYGWNSIHPGIDPDDFDEDDE